MLIEGPQTVVPRSLPYSLSWGLHGLQGAEEWESGFSFHRHSVTQCSHTETQKTNNATDPSEPLHTVHVTSLASTFHISSCTIKPNQQSANHPHAITFLKLKKSVVPQCVYYQHPVSHPYLPSCFLFQTKQILLIKG